VAVSIVTWPRRTARGANSIYRGKAAAPPPLVKWVGVVHHEANMPKGKERQEKQRKQMKKRKKGREKMAVFRSISWVPVGGIHSL